MPVIIQASHQIKSTLCWPSSLKPKFGFLNITHGSGLFQLAASVANKQSRLSSESASSSQSKLDANNQPGATEVDKPAEEPVKYNPMPIMKNHGTNLGYVARTLAIDKKKIAKLELKRWLKKQTFDLAHLKGLVEALQQPDWDTAIPIIDRLYDSNQSWSNRIPSSFLAELAQKKLSDPKQLEDLLILIGYRIATEEDVLISSQLLYAGIQASLSFGNLVISKDLVNYSISFAVEIARVEVEKSSLTCSSLLSPTKPPDPSLALRPLIAAIAGLMTTRSTTACNRTPIFGFLSRLIKTLINLCGSLESVLERVSKPNQHLICRAIIYSTFSPNGHSIKPTEINQILKQNLPMSTLRLAMIAMIQTGNWDQANQFELLLRANKSDNNSRSSKVELDLAFHHARRRKIGAYSRSEKFHQQFLDRLLAIEAQPSGVSVHTYTSYMSTLFRHHVPKMALQVWERMMAKGVVPDAAAIQVAMTIYIDLARPLEAVQLFHRFVCHNSSKSHPAGSGQSDRSVVANIQIIATYARALDLSHRFSMVYQLWKNLQPEWGLEPDSRIFASLISSARKLTYCSVTPISNPTLRSASPRVSAIEPGKETYWDGEPASQVAIQLFWMILYENWASLAATVKAPVLSCSSWLGMSIYSHGSLLERLCRLNRPPPASAAPLRARNEHYSQQARLATTVIPSLKFQTRWSTIMPNRSSFKDMVELLGLADQAGLIPLLLSWMKTLDVKPSQDLLTRAYYWIHCSSDPSRRFAGLDHFVRDWIEDIGLPKHPSPRLEVDDADPDPVRSSLGNDANGDDESPVSGKLMIPTEEIIQAHHLERLEWANRIVFSQQPMAP